MKEISLIVATSTDGGIGYKNTIPWNIPEELAHFKNITCDINDDTKMNCVIMGKNTWLSLKKPLNNRFNIIISSSINDNDIKDYYNVSVKKNIEDALEYSINNTKIEKIYIIGGALIYDYVFKNFMNIIHKIHLSIIIDKYYTCDKFISTSFIFDYFHYSKEFIKINDNFIYMIGENKNFIKK